MPQSIYRPKILEILDDGPTSLRTINDIIGKNKNFRKSLHNLLRDGIIEINGYDKTCKSFAEQCMMFKKVDVQFENPIYVKGLLDNPLVSDNYFKIQEIFRNRIGKINDIYNNEIKRLSDLTEKMPLKEAISLGYYEPNTIFRSYKVYEDPKDKKGKWEKITFEDILEKDSEAKIFYLTERFGSKLALSQTPKKIADKFYSSKRTIDFNGPQGKNNSFVDAYKIFFNHLPINNWAEQRLFNHFVIGALREESENREDRLWELATDLADENLSLFVQKLRVIDYISALEFDSHKNQLRF